MQTVLEQLDALAAPIQSELRTARMRLDGTRAELRHTARPFEATRLTRRVERLHRTVRELEAKLRLLQSLSDPGENSTA